MPVRLRAVGAIASHDLRLLLRQRWVAIYAGVFAALASAVSYFGLAVVELTGWQEFDRTAASLLNLVLYLVPLAAMLMAVQLLRVEGGASDQLFAEPIARTEVVLGKVATASAAQLLSLLLGFGAAGLVIGVRTGTETVGQYLALVGFAALVGVVFIALASALTVASGRGARAYAAVLTAWFVFLVLMDLALVGSSLLLDESWANRAALAGVFLNPIGSARVGALVAIGGPGMFGPAGALLVRALGSAETAMVALVGSLVAWGALGVGAAALLLEKQDI